MRTHLRKVRGPTLVSGEFVELPRAGGDGVIRGLVHDIRHVHGNTRVSIYSYATRSVAEYRLDRRGRLHPLGAGHEADDERPRLGAPTRRDGRARHRHPPVAPGSAEVHEGEEPESPEGPERRRWAAPMVLALVASTLAFVIIFPFIQGAVAELSTSGMGYQDFLQREMSLSQLVSTVATRVDYRTDLEDYWSAPIDVWGSRMGDCEDHAMVISRYLAEHDVPHTVLGLSLTDELQGHVVVVAETESGPVLLDPTRAT
ncbi:MAG: transglutaminase-like cysteine peptidase, partial [Spirochaetota bacterium]